MKKEFFVVLAIVILLFSLTGYGAFSYTKTKQTYQINLTKLQQTHQQDVSQLLSLKKELASDDNAYKTLAASTDSKNIQGLQNQLDAINNALDSYATIQKQIAQANSLHIDTTAATASLNTIASDILSNKFTDASTAEQALTSSLQNSITIALRPTPAPTVVQATPKPITNLAGSSFTTTKIHADNTDFTVDYITIDLNSAGLVIKTDTQNTSDCANNCPVTNLMDYYNRNNAFAAINGTYLCPDTYASCAGKTNSFDFPVYNSRTHTWLNQGNLFWTNRSMLAFQGTHPIFYPDSSKYTTQTAVSAGFVMAPGLVYNQQVIVGNFPLDTKSATAYTTRGAIAIKGSSLIIADAFSATVPQMADIMQAMQVDDAISIDGGGSTAMIYNGSYMLGPGRNIPNAIIFSRQ